VRALENSDAFKAYAANGQDANVSEFDFRDMLL
jgi:hypothetical protein